MDKNILKDTITELADEILSCHKKYLNQNQFGLYDGRAGIALFLFYCYRIDNNIDYYNLGMDLIQECLDLIDDGFSLPTLCSGIAGFCWMIDHLIENQIIDSEYIEITTLLEPYLIKNMLRYGEDKNFDFLHGGNGIAYYLEHKTRTPEIRNNLELYFQQLVNSAQLNEDGCYWSNTSNQEYKEANMGLSHGMISTLTVLGKVKNEFDSAGKLFSKSLEFVKKNIRDYNSVGYAFPNTKDSDYPSRLVWCYGDPGAATSLYHVSDDSTKKLLIDIMEVSTKRNTMKKACVEDVAFCHGSISLAMMYQQMYQYTGKKTFLNAVENWLNISFSLREDKSKYISGFSSYIPISYEPLKKDHVTDISLLNGVSGVGMVLLTLLNPDNSDWLKFFMLR